MNHLTQAHIAAAVPVPPRLARRPRDKHGRLVPWFVGYVNGQPDHRLVRPGGITDAVRFNHCFLCGQTLGAYKTFVLGPMCTINRVSAEPPSHRDCAEYAVQACPFLTHPHMRRRPNLPEDTVAPDGTMDPRNPGASVTWTVRTYSKKPGMQLFDLGEPAWVEWWREGRRATYSEALDALVAGCDVLQDEAAKDTHPLRAAASLDEQYWKATNYLPGNFTAPDGRKNYLPGGMVGGSR
ncbi:hypothetical protein DI272_19190 [Streptomyces sp. Act143]|uniref:hypothetical protein n=1 Tax=Streptomyces sp. Act143 TaxID=2200760 RepID=UPI000D6741FA|nr:hypothetical protein [Streptomyces sp. Act143]PWI16056.1 hypothetical protein DI272_19190 [Streptomyces sp. Act143]